MISQSNNVLAIEWDRTEARYVWASVSGRRVLIKAMGRIAAIDGDAFDNAGPMIADIKSLLRIKKPQVTVGLARSDCEEAEAVLPPAEEHEIPQFVVNQAHERWPSLADDAIIDYYSLESSADATPRVSIAVLSIEQKSEIDAILKQAGWKVSGIKLRHLGAVNLLRRQIDLAPLKQSVLLSLGRTDAELIVFANDQITLVRTIPLSTNIDPAALAEKLALEIQRSLMVSANPNLVGAEQTDSLFLFGNAEEQQRLANQLGTSLQTKVTLLDPLQGLPKSIKGLPDHIHQFASLLGLIFDQPKSQMVDFMAPKCAKAFPVIYKRLAFYATAAALGIGFLIWSGLSQVADLRDKNIALKKELNSAQKRIDRLNANTKVVEYVNNWSNDDINWLDELRGLSLRFPERTQAQVKSMSMSIGTGGRGVISMNVRAKDDLVISQLEQAIRDSHHTVRTNQLSQSSTDEEFPWQFGATVLVNRRNREEYALEDLSFGLLKEMESNPLPLNSEDTSDIELPELRGNDPLSEPERAEAQLRREEQ